MSDVAGLLNKHFPTSLIIPTIGNNDDHFHDEACTEEDKTAGFYQTLYTHWFTQMTGNNNLLKNTDLKASFLNGGYYRVDVNDKVSILAYNTMYYVEDADKSKWDEEAD